jgi:hypothetical protein
VAIGIKVQLGDFYTDKGALAHLIKNYAANELRFTSRYFNSSRKEENLPFFYQELATRFCKPQATTYF